MYVPGDGFRRIRRFQGRLENFERMLARRGLHLNNGSSITAAVTMAASSVSTSTR